jgi:septum site-determining protein MinC
MKTKQKSVRIFEIISNDYDKVVGLIESKYILLRKYLLVIKTNNEKIKQYFNSKQLETRFVSYDFEASNQKLEINEESTKTEIPLNKELNKKEKENSTKTEIFDKIIRSGFEIKSANKLIFLKKINAGAKIYSSKEIELFGEVFGEVVCNGDYLIVKKAKKGAVIFHNEPLQEITKLSFISKQGIKELE